MEATKQQTQTHFVLVHGACHGAWCWYKLKPLLESHGHKVTALDLSASGINMKKIEELRTLYDYTEPLMEVMESLPQGEKVVLVGHNVGGLNLDLAIDKFSQKISVAVFLTAFMPNTVHKPSFVIEQKTRRLISLKSCVQPMPTVYGNVICLATDLTDHCGRRRRTTCRCIAGAVVAVIAWFTPLKSAKASISLRRTIVMSWTSSKPASIVASEITAASESSSILSWRLSSNNRVFITLEVTLTSMFFGPKFLASKLYQLCPIQDFTLATILVRTGLLFLEDLAQANNFSNKGYGSVTRVYVVCNNDYATPKVFQRWMIENNEGMKEVKEIKGVDHMPMFSKPRELTTTFS
ncbi:hypothetical protein HYC85_002448 [Camellia sinensis]|uniref:AB hydrolase-1 domain-containing protein n=1 Tax=Camellia sinensis TaxID=4442 RepID=A0A7J7I8J5_CAMSI|nr:hypothetical protein HYC85_002448 [Camellia sinensis]